MKNRFIFSMIFFILLFMLAGCGGGTPEEQPPAQSNDPTPLVEAAVSDEPTPEPAVVDEDVNEPDLPEAAIEPEPEPIPFNIPFPIATGTDVLENDKVVIDISNMGDGYVMVKFLEETTRNLRVRITFPDGDSHLYILTSDGEYNIYPLSSGSGKYKIEVFQGAANGSYSPVLAETVSLELNSEFAPFLRPNYYVNYTENSNAVKYAWDLTKSQPEDLDKIASIYKYVIENVTYDMDFARTVQSGYVPDIDRVMKDKTGICFDYAVLMTAMLRSQGIPTKLVFGYVGTVYHAWINVYTEEAGWVDIIQFDGSKWVLMDPTFASSLLDDSSALSDFVGDGSNYDIKFIF